MSIKPRSSSKRDKPEVLSVPAGFNYFWSMDFMGDANNGRSMRAFNAINDC